MNAVVAEIMERFERYGWSVLPGEWGKLNTSSRVPLHDALKDGDTELVGELLATMFDGSLVAGLVTIVSDSRGHKRERENYDAMVHDLTLWRAYTDSVDYEMLRAPGDSVGGVRAVNVGGVPVLVDTPRHDHYAHRLSQLIPQGSTVLEIGGGYGGFALQAVRRGLRVVIADIPETLYMAYYWLKVAGVNVRWWDDDDNESPADVVLYNGLAYVGNVSAVLASHSLCEFDRETAKSWVDVIERDGPRWFLHDTAHVLLPPQESPATYERWPEIPSHELVPSGYKEHSRAPTWWHGTGGRYWEFLYER